jgi:hypothetical protein
MDYRKGRNQALKRIIKDLSHNQYGFVLAGLCSQGPFSTTEKRNYWKTLRVTILNPTWKLFETFFYIRTLLKKRIQVKAWV